MFRFLTRSRPRRRAIGRPRASLNVERLETRDCPSGLAVYVYAVPEPNHIAHVFGGVIGNRNDPTTVTLSGAVSGQVTVNSFGSFTFETNQATVGIIEASAADAAGNIGSSQTQLTVNPPVIVAATIAYNHKRSITITGHV